MTPCEARTAAYNAVARHADVMDNVLDGSYTRENFMSALNALDGLDSEQGWRDGVIQLSSLDQAGLTGSVSTIDIMAIYSTVSGKGYVNCGDSGEVGGIPDPFVLPKMSRRLEQKLDPAGRYYPGSATPGPR